MIDDWRGKWNNASGHTSALFPFGFVQVHIYTNLTTTSTTGSSLSISHHSWQLMAQTTHPPSLQDSQSSAGPRQQTMGLFPTLVSLLSSWQWPWTWETPPLPLAPSILETSKTWVTDWLWLGEPSPMETQKFTSLDLLQPLPLSGIL